jgi:hypothetical protein
MRTELYRRTIESLPALRVFSVKKWRSVAPELLPFFQIKQGRLTHTRLRKELEKVETQRQSRAAAGSKVGTATALKNKGASPANAAARLPARLQHLPEPYKKEGNLVLVEGGNSAIVLDRIHDMDLFAACEAIAGKSRSTFNASLSRRASWLKHKPSSISRKRQRRLPYAEEVIILAMGTPKRSAICSFRVTQLQSWW